MEYINEFYGTIPVIKLPIGSSEKFNHAQKAISHAEQYMQSSKFFYVSRKS